MHLSFLTRASARYTSRRARTSESLPVVNIYPAVIESIPSYPQPFSCHNACWVHIHQLVTMLPPLLHLGARQYPATLRTFGMTTFPVRPVRHAYGDPRLLLTLSNWRCDSVVYVGHAANFFFKTPLYKSHHHERETKLLYK
jgi:hypothetical protein